MLNGKKYKSFFGRRIVIITALLILLLDLSGCSPILTIGGYKHVDMSHSRYREQIRRKADELAASQKTTDKRTAAELYGSIRELKLMDKCIGEYFEKEPAIGVYLLIRGEEIHKFYKSAR